MATLSSSQGKRHSDGDDGGNKSKRHKRSSRSSSRERKAKDPERKKKKKNKAKDRDKEHDKDQLKVRSVSELAQLVQSGQIQIPKSLVHYQGDRVQLLDQVFTILSPDDVEGMLPDILKGLKMKTIRHLCSEQLRNLTDEQITMAITNEESSSSSVSKQVEVDSVSPSVEDSRQADTKMAVEQRELRTDSVKDDVAEIKLEHKQIKAEEHEGVKQEGQLKAEEHKGSKANLKRPLTDSVPRSKELKASRCSEHEGLRRSVDKTEGTTPSKKEGRSSDNSNPNPDPTAPHYSPSNSQTVARHSKQACKDTRETKPPAAAGPSSALSAPQGGKREDILVEKESDNLVLKSAELLEMELRRRALEAELRRANSVNERTSAEADRADDEGNVGDKGNLRVIADEDSISVHPQYDGDDDVGGFSSVKLSTSGGAVRGEDTFEIGRSKKRPSVSNVGEFLEERLRERALQAMLAKKRISES